MADEAQALWVHDSYITVEHSIQTSIRPSYQDMYHFSELELGPSCLWDGISLL